MPARSRSGRLLRVVARAAGVPMAALLAAILAWTSMALPAHADPPGDVGTADETSVLPDAPDGYVSEQRGEVRWEFHERARSVAEDLFEVHREEWPRVVDELGVAIEDDLVIRIGRNPEEMAALAPEGHPPPSYASGVAYPRRGLVLLTLTAPETWQRPDVASVLVHELSHVALHRAVGGHPTPRWFSEGVAIHQAREHNLERVKTLWSGTVSGELIPLSRLSAAFPRQPHRVNLAYAQSADFVRWLLARDDGDARFREAVQRLGRGQPFETALERTYSIPLVNLEIEWHEALSERFQAWPLLFGSGGLWVLAALLIMVAYVRRKHRDKKTVKRWEMEERAELAPSQVLGAASLAASLAREDDAHHVFPPEPRMRDSGVPTIEHDGRSHTLH